MNPLCTSRSSVPSASGTRVHTTSESNGRRSKTEAVRQEYASLLKGLPSSTSQSIRQPSLPFTLNRCPTTGRKSIFPSHSSSSSGWVRYSQTSSCDRLKRQVCLISLGIIGNLKVTQTYE